MQYRFSYNIIQYSKNMIWRDIFLYIVFYQLLFHYIILHYTILHYITLHHILYCIILYCIIYILYFIKVYLIYAYIYLLCLYLYLYYITWMLYIYIHISDMKYNTIYKYMYHIQILIYNHILVIPRCFFRSSPYISDEWPGRSWDLAAELLKISLQPDEVTLTASLAACHSCQGEGPGGAGEMLGMIYLIYDLYKT